MTPPAAKPESFLDETKSLACIHCGLCLGSCPTYLETGNENDSPRGRIYIMRALQDGRMPMADKAVRHIDLCLGCRACESACPSGVQYGALLEETRDFIEKKHRRSWFQTVLRRVAIEQVFPFPRRLRLALLPARLIKGLGLGNWLPKFARDALNLIPEQALADALPEICPAWEQPAKGRVGFVSGCVMSVMFAETNKSSVRLINRAGHDVVTPKGQGCCGALYAHSGQLEKARACARHNIVVFEKSGVEEIVINAAGCGSTLKEYGHLLEGDPEYAARAKKFSAKVRDLTEWLRQKGPDPARSPEGEGVTYHDACHLAHPQRITQQPRQLVREVAGRRFVELAEAEVCCGSAGSYNLTEPEMAERLQERKVKNILASGAKVVVTSNPGCILQIRAGLKKAGANGVEVLHVADYLVKNSGGSTRQSR